MNKVAIEVFIPAYNSELTIAATIESVLDQTEPVPSITVVDDGSSDRTEAIVRTFASVRYIRNSENLGATGNWTRCMQLATMDHVVLLHDDDVLLPDWHRKCRALLRTSPDPTMTTIFLGYADMTPNGKVTHVFSVTKGPSVFPPGAWLAAMWKACLLGVMTSGATVYARRSFAAVGGFPDDSYPLMADVPLHFRLAKHGWVAYDPEPLALMAQFPTSLSKNNRPTLYSGSMKFLRELADDLAEVVHTSRSEVIIHGLFPYIVIDLCRPFLARLRGLPDTLFSDPRAARRDASLFKLAQVCMKFALRVGSVRLHTWRWRQQLLPYARDYAAKLEASRRRLSVMLDAQDQLTLSDGSRPKAAS